MKNMKKRRWPKILITVLAAMVVLIVLIPLLIPVEGASGLKEPKDLIGENGDIVTIPFEGTDGIDTYYVYQPAQQKTERNFILLHGSLYNSNTWNEAIAYLSTKGNVYAYDQAPYGLSEKLLEGDWTGENPYTTKAAVAQLQGFMDELGIESATLVGSSFGGVIAAEAAVEMPERVEELIFVDAAVFVTESVPQWLVELPQVERLGPLFARSLASGDGFYESTFYDKAKLTDERMMWNKAETQVNNWDLALWEYLQAWGVAPSDVSTKLDQIEQRALVISGEEDTVVPLEQSIQLADQLPNASIRTIPECGHMPHEEKPEAFIEVLEDWLAD